MIFAKVFILLPWIVVSYNRNIMFNNDNECIYLGTFNSKENPIVRASMKEYISHIFGYNQTVYLTSFTLKNWKSVAKTFSCGYLKKKGIKTIELSLNKKWHDNLSILFSEPKMKLIISNCLSSNTTSINSRVITLEMKNCEHELEVSEAENTYKSQILDSISNITNSSQLLNSTKNALKIIYDALSKDALFMTCNDASMGILVISIIISYMISKNSIDKIKDCHIIINAIYLLFMIFHIFLPISIRNYDSTIIYFILATAYMILRILFLYHCNVRCVQKFFDSFTLLSIGIHTETILHEMTSPVYWFRVIFKLTMTIFGFCKINEMELAEIINFFFGILFSCWSLIVDTFLYNCPESIPLNRIDSTLVYSFYSTEGLWAVKFDPFILTFIVSIISLIQSLLSKQQK